jgi:cytochrome c553
MKKVATVLTIALVFVIAAGVLVAQQNRASNSVPPPWAYGFATPPPPPGAPAAPAPAPAAAPAAPDPTQHKIAGSTKSFTAAQVRDQFGPADWFPEDHPAMPDIVAHGRRDAMIVACSLCHYPNGKGRPENAGVSGLPESYFIQTMLDFKNGLRKTADARKGNTGRMAAFAKAMTDEEIRATAKYFGSMKWTPWIRVVETDTVPKTRIAGGMFLALEGAEAGKEPIGQRIIEVPEKLEDTELLRNPRSGFIAYVPQGAVKKGQALVAAASNKTVQCGICHGSDLEGLGPVPGLNGRSPSYMVRQLYDMQNGFRTGEWTSLMKPVVEKLSADDMINIAAYLASRPPGAGAQSRAAK